MGYIATPWTPGEDAVVRKAYAAGESDSEIAERLGRRMESVHNRICALGLSSGNNARFWSPDEDARLLELIAQGATWPEIEKEIGRTAKACSSRRSKLIPETVVRKEVPANRPSFAARWPLPPGDPVSWSAITLHGTPYDAGELCA